MTGVRHSGRGAGEIMYFDAGRVVRDICRVVAICGLLTGCTDPNEGSSVEADAGFSLIEELAIEAIDSLPDMALTTVSDLVVTADGRIVTAHNEEVRIRIFDSFGKLVTAFGKRGGGPEELSNIGLIGLVADTLWIFDGVRKRVLVSSLAGTVIRTVQIPQLSPLQNDRFYDFHALSPSGQLWLSRAVLQNATQPGTVPAGTMIDFVVWDVDATTMSVVLQKPVPSQRMIQVRLGSSTVGIAQTLRPELLVAVAPSGSSLFAVADAALWEGMPGFVRISQTQQDATSTQRELNLGATAVPEDYAQSVRSRYLAANYHANRGGRGLALTDAQLEEVRDSIDKQLYVPKHYPVASTVIVGADGSLWLQGVADRQRWIIIHDGELYSQVMVPTSLKLHHVTKDAAWGVRTDTITGLPVIVRGAVRPVTRF